MSLIPLRLEPSDKSELVSQLLYGDLFKILETRKNWSKIRLTLDDYEGYVDNKQLREISEDDYLKIKKRIQPSLLILPNLFRMRKNSYSLYY